MLSDENISGAQSKMLTLILSGQIVPAVLAGDYDNNGVVDAGDYAAWRKSLANGTSLDHNETVTLGSTDEQDYAAWRANFRASGFGSGNSLTESNTSIPEPTSLVLALLALSGPLLARRTRSHRYE